MRYLQFVALNQKEELRGYLNDYLTELSAVDPDIKFDENGVPIYRWFDHYFTDKDRTVVFLIVDGNIAGFGMVRELGEDNYELAEFYIIPEFRRGKNGIFLAKNLCLLFKGCMQISTRHTNLAGKAFWARFVEGFAIKSESPDDIWQNYTVDTTTYNLD